MHDAAGKALAQGQEGTSPSRPQMDCHLSSKASRLLQTSLTEALSGDMADQELPLLFFHGVGGLPTYLEMLLQAGTGLDTVNIAEVLHLLTESIATP